MYIPDNDRIFTILGLCGEIGLDGIFQTIFRKKHNECEDHNNHTYCLGCINYYACDNNTFMRLKLERHIGISDEELAKKDRKDVKKLMKLRINLSLDNIIDAVNEIKAKLEQE